jgi:flagellar secretion chaperone FliS
MSGFGAGAYRRVAVESGVNAADPHRLVLMLFDAALDATRLAEAHLAARQIPEKCAAIAKATRIIDSGLKAGVNPAADRQMAARLVLLYDYMMLRLLQSNARNDVAALREVRQLLGGLRDSWAAIAPSAGAGQAQAAGGSADRFAAASAPMPARRLAVTG